MLSGEGHSSRSSKVLIGIVAKVGRFRVDDLEKALWKRSACNSMISGPGVR